MPVGHLLKTVLLITALLLLAAQPALPPVSWTCPMHPEVLEDKKGVCSICRMDLVQVTVAVSWTCPDHPEIARIDPGTCPGGGAMVRTVTPRAHGNHNPQHGGVFFMAPDNWHHLEGTYSADGGFHLHLYDDYSKPLPHDTMKRARARVGTTPLRPAANGEYLEAMVRPVSLPAQMTARVVFEPKGPEYRFDFTFDRFSSDPAISHQPLAISHPPGDIVDVLARLGASSRAIKDLIDRGAFAEIYVPALEAKDLALTLDARTPDIGDRTAGPPTAIGVAVKRVVRAAWLLDWSGDLGDRTQIADAYAEFAAALVALESGVRAKSR